MLFVIDIFWKLQFLKQINFRLLNVERTLTYQKPFLWKSAIYHTIIFPFDAEVAEKFLNGMYVIQIPLGLSRFRTSCWEAFEVNSCALGLYFMLVHLPPDVHLFTVSLREHLDTIIVQWGAAVVSENIM